MILALEAVTPVIDGPWEALAAVPYDVHEAIVVDSAPAAAVADLALNVAADTRYVSGETPYTPPAPQVTEQSRFGANRAKGPSLLGKVVTVATAFASFAVAGCTTDTNHEAPRVTHATHRVPLTHCLSKPLLPPADSQIPVAPSADASSTAWDNYFKAEQIYSDRLSPPPLTIHIDSLGFPRTEPDTGYDNTVAERVDNATVKIVTSDGTATGSIIKGPNGERYILTADHVVDTGPKSDLSGVQIFDNQGKVTTVKEACGVLEDPQGKPLVGGKGHTETRGDLDMALLVPEDQTIGKGELTIGAVQPKDGQPVIYHNYQQRAPIGYPATYDGIMANNTAEGFGATVITGIDAYRGGNGLDYSGQPGDSGGPVLDSAGKIVDMSVTGPLSVDPTSRLSGYDTAELLKMGLNATIVCAIDSPPTIYKPCVIGQESGVFPTESYTVTGGAILKVVRAWQPSH